VKYTGSGANADREYNFIFFYFFFVPRLLDTTILPAIVIYAGDHDCPPGRIPPHTKHESPDRRIFRCKSSSTMAFATRTLGVPSQLTFPATILLLLFTPTTALPQTYDQGGLPNPTDPNSGATGGWGSGGYQPPSPVGSIVACTLVGTLGLVAIAAFFFLWRRFRREGDTEYEGWRSVLKSALPSRKESRSGSQAGSRAGSATGSWKEAEGVPEAPPKAVVYGKEEEGGVKVKAFGDLPRPLSRYDSVRKTDGQRTPMAPGTAI
jgi:hypothetical protein